MSRHTSAAHDAAEVHSALLERLTPAPVYRVVWRVELAEAEGVRTRGGASREELG